MAPLQPLGPSRSLRGGKRSSSFHGRTSACAGTDATPASSHQMRRPKTQPDLLAACPGGRRMIVSPPDFFRAGNNGEQMRRVPAKVLVNVNLQGSLGALQVMASTDWTVDQLVSASIRQYLKEGRRPPPPTPDPSAFSLHYSQFCLDCLDRKEKLIGLGSRNFFLCPTQTVATTHTLSSNLSSASSASDSSSDTLPVSSQSLSSCFREADKASKISVRWLRFMDFLS